MDRRSRVESHRWADPRATSEVLSSMAGGSARLARHGCESPGRACLWVEVRVFSYQHLPLRRCICSNRHACGELPDNTLPLLAPERDGIDHTLARCPVPALQLGEDGTSLLQGNCREVIMCLVELDHECINHDPEEGLLHRKGAGTLSEGAAFPLPRDPFKEALAGFIWGKWSELLLQFAGRDFYGGLGQHV